MTITTLINPDGTMQPIDEPYFRPLLIAPDTWQVLSDGDYFYVVAGDAEAVCIDTGCGAGDVRAYAQQLSGRQVTRVFNTCERADHTAGNRYFDTAYMSAPAADVVAGDNKVVIRRGDTFDLGNRVLEAFAFPDRYPGSLAFLDRREGIFFVGRELSDFNKELYTITVNEFVAQMEEMEEYYAEFRMVAASDVIFFRDYIRKYRQCAQNILRGNVGIPMTPPLPERTDLPEGTRLRGPAEVGVKEPEHQEDYRNQLMMQFADAKVIYCEDRI